MPELDKLEKQTTGLTNKILLVDDDTDLLETLVDYIAEIDCSYDIAPDGAVALDLLKSNDYTVIVTDMKMPNADGMKILQFVNQQCPYVDVIIMTGYSDEYAYTDIIKAGATDFIEKPFYKDELFAKLNRVFRERVLKQKLEDEIRYENSILTNLHTSQQQLDIKNTKLSNANAALEALLDQRKKDQNHLEEQVLSQHKSLLFPLLNKLRHSSSTEDRNSLIDLLEFNLKEITSPYIKKLSSLKVTLTPREIQIANMIQQGMDTKEIATLMYLSPGTISNHRKRMRKKLGLNGKKINLCSYLLSFK